MPISAGEYNFVWNATDFRGTDVASGIYFIRMVIKNQSAISQKVLLVR
jgi:flagellar hook assembly protein FlgD